MNDLSGTAATGTETVYEFARAQTITGWGAISEWWVWAGILVFVVAAIGSCTFYYRRDAAELPRRVRWTLIGLRLTVILALIFVFFDLVRRTQRRVVRPSEVVVLVDTSQSMSLPANGELDSVSRIERTRQLVGESELLATLGENHRTSVYAFGDTNQPELVFTSAIADSPDGQTSDSLIAAGVGDAGEILPWRNLAWFGVASLVLAALASLIAFALGARGAWRASSTASHSQGLSSPASFVIALAAISMVLGCLCTGIAYSVEAPKSLAQILTGAAPQASSPANDQEPDDEQQPKRNSEVDWESVLAARGIQSRIGDALRSVMVDHDPSTLAAVVLLTDGQNNGGAALSSAVALARRHEVPIYPLGLGSSQPPTNVRVVDLEAPRRVYPGDKFAVASVLQATGEQDLEVEVQLLDALDVEEDKSGEANESATSLPGGQVLQTQTVKLPADATLTGIRFEVDPQTVGRRRLAVRILAPAGDGNAADDMQTARYEVVARRLRVLAVAGGPTREYRFVRNLLHRDQSVELDVWLQTGSEGMSQDAHEVLTGFPDTADRLFQYDAILMFDPDWSAIDAASLDLIDRFLSQQAGGLVLVAGPVYHPRITTKRNDPRLNQIRGFFPVNLSGRGVLSSGGRQGGTNPWPLKFTPESSAAEFLWVAETPEESFELWKEDGSVYDFVGVKSAKPGAKVYAYYSDPTTEISGSLPIFFASQFYGAGRVFFQASGEVWRLRRAGDQYFDNYYTKLTRWVSEGRLLRDSNRGVLLADMTRAMVGQTISLRAVLVDDQFQPLSEPYVMAKLLSPDGAIKDLRLQPAADSPRGGTYTGSFVATASGGYEVRLTVGDALDEQVLRRSIQVRLPTSELERPRRDDETMAQLASVTRGQYTPIEIATTANELTATLAEQIVPQPQVSVLPGTPDQPFNERRNAALMWLIASALTFEWLTRRLHKLA